MKKFKAPYTYWMNIKPESVTITYAVALSDAIYQRYGYKKTVENKQKITQILSETITDLDNLCLDLTKAQELIEWYKEYLSYKIMTTEITDFEKEIINILKIETVRQNSYKDIGIIASIPMAIDLAKKREEFSDLIDKIRPHSNFFGEIKKRYDLNLKLLSKKYIKNNDFWVINAVDDDNNMFFYFGHKEPNYDINDYMKIRATVKKHEQSKFSDCKETHLTRIIYC